MKMPPTVVENQNSSLLSTEENLQVFKLLGNRCQTIATTVVQLFTTVPPHHSQWIKKETGVLCFVKDNIKKNYFFRLFSLKKNHMLWEHEIYNNMEYMAYAPFFHVFEGEEYIVAFNFACHDEAKAFKIVVDQKVMIKKRREEKRARQIYHSQSVKLPAAVVTKSPNLELKLAKRKRNITKADISTPMDFKHVSHVGWNPNSGFDVMSEDEQLKSFFQKAGVSEKQLQDKETREFIYDFINKHGGIDTALESTRDPPAVPPRGPIRQSQSNQRPAPPPPPVGPRIQQQQDNHGAFKKPHPPSPPALPGGNTPPAPPPPPPPPMGMPQIESGGGAALPPPPMPESVTVPNGNAALMESIRNGMTLKPTEERRAAPVEDARGDLLSEIRKGTTLKPVGEREIKPSSNPSPKSTGRNDLASALAKALADRSKVIHSEDDDDDTSSTSNDEEWE